MRRSQSFLKTRKEAPADEEALNAQLLIRAGYIHKEMAGVYSYLPLGKKVLENIMQVIREEINAIGGEELLMSTLQPKETWEKSGRWHDDVVDVWFKTRLHDGEGYHKGQELGLGNTHEEALTAMMRNFIGSYKDLPKFAYQFQTKFRNEMRSKSGILRCREFIMKDLYSFTASQEQHDEFYQKAQAAYSRIFERLGLGEYTYLTYASGGVFTNDFSHEFQTVTDIGEDTIYLDEQKKVAVNKEVYNDENLQKLGLNKDQLVEKRGVEVGNIFPLGSRFSEALGLSFTDEDGTLNPVIMGSYGIGPGRVMGTIVEHFADGQGIKWPLEVAPYRAYICRLSADEVVVTAADELYKRLTEAGIEVIYDDRDERAGAMFADAELLGIPYRIVVSAKTVEAGQFELKQRGAEEVKLLAIDQIIEQLTSP